MHDADRSGIPTQFLHTSRGKLAYVMREVSDRWVVLAHGFLEDKDERGIFPVFMDACAAEGLSSIAFDASGCGQSDEVPIEFQSLHEDFHDIERFLLERSARSVSLVGFSLGGFLCLSYIPRARLPIDACVLWAPVTDRIEFPNKLVRREHLDELELMGRAAVTVTRGVRSVFTLLKSFVEDRERIDQRELMEAVRGVPILILHGSDDGIIPPEHSIAAVRIAQCELEIIDGANHFFSEHTDALIEKTVRFLIAHR